MAREITGDITAITDGYIMHQVNCQNVMGAGVAKSLATKYPKVKEAYHNFAKTYAKPKERFRWIQPVRVSESLVICNSFSQFSFGNSRMTGICYTDMLTLKSALKRFDARAKKAGKRAYVPAYIGCGISIQKTRVYDYRKFQNHNVKADYTTIKGETYAKNYRHVC